mmetsp:Transcript_25421/g.29035  ORF Transcript_25421/g.29035 Transcript_25421/m.29035 type:complete len:150 (+) Transcript_25421:295-744(+)
MSIILVIMIIYIIVIILMIMKKQAQSQPKPKKSFDPNDNETQNNNSVPCETCRGSGILICQFCHGVGYVDFGVQEKGTIGERLMNKNTSSRPNGGTGGKDSRSSSDRDSNKNTNNKGGTDIECPICDENGEIKCKQCHGSGWIAKWQQK